MNRKFFLLFVLAANATINHSYTHASLCGKTDRIQSESQYETPFRFREIARTILREMEENEIPGLSIAIVNRDSTLWIDAFGRLRRETADSVDIHTTFSLQSISKTVTATAVLFAVQEGLVDLDIPIHVYLPDFTVNSRFEKHPEKRMTLRHLLSHRAGFTHEAPIGNNYQVAFGSFEDHIRSISKTWLKAPVGARYSYSNLGIDLAGYILEKRSGIPFARYVESRIFEPLGMKDSSFDWSVISKQKNRAIGRADRSDEVPLEYAMIPSGACYTSVQDMAKFVRFHMNRGRCEERILLNEKYLDEMYTPPLADQRVGYGLGIAILENNGQPGYYHSGGGFGFLTVAKWIPHLDIGVVVLTNYSGHGNVHIKIADELINRYGKRTSPVSGETVSTSTVSNRTVIHLSEEEYARYMGIYITPEANRVFKVLIQDTLFGAQGEGFFIPFHFFSKQGDFYVSGFGPELDGEYRFIVDDQTGRPAYVLNRTGGVIFYFNEKADEGPGPGKPEWRRWAGRYTRKMVGKVIDTHEIALKSGFLYFDGFRMREYIPGLFYLSNGEVVDFRGASPTYRNILLFRAE